MSNINIWGDTDWDFSKIDESPWTTDLRTVITPVKINFLKNNYA